MSHVSSHEDPLGSMALDVQQVIKPFIENEDDVVEIMRLLSGLGASVLLSSGLGGSNSTAQELRDNIKLLRDKFTENGGKATGQTKTTKARPSVRRVGQKRAPVKPDHTWRDGDPYVFHAPRKDGKPEQLPVPTDPQIRERYPWWWAALAPPEDDDPTPTSHRRTTSSRAPSAMTGPDFQFSSMPSSLGTKTRAYLEEELSRPLSVSGLSDVLEQSGTSGCTYRTAVEGERSMASRGGGWRLDLDPADFNEARSSSKSSSIVSITPSELEDRTMLAEMVPDRPHSSRSSSTTSANVEAESLMEIIDNWQKELRDLRYAADKRKGRRSASSSTVRSGTSSNSISSPSSLSMR